MWRVGAVGVLWRFVLLGVLDKLSTQQSSNNDTIAAIVRGLDPVDWVQLRLTANLSPADRVLRGMRAQAFAMAAYRGALARRFPDLSLSELNMKTLAHFTPVRMEK